MRRTSRDMANVTVLPKLAWFIDDRRDTAEICILAYVVAVDGTLVSSVRLSRATSNLFSTSTYSAFAPPTFLPEPKNNSIHYVYSFAAHSLTHPAPPTQLFQQSATGGSRRDRGGSAPAHREVTFRLLVWDFRLDAAAQENRTAFSRVRVPWGRFPAFLLDFFLVFVPGVWSSTHRQ